MHVDSRGRLPQNVVFLLILLVVERLFRQSEDDCQLAIVLFNVKSIETAIRI